MLIKTTENAIPSTRALTDHEMRMSEDVGYSYVDRLAQLEEDLYAQGQFVREGSHLHSMAKFKKPQARAQTWSQSCSHVGGYSIPQSAAVIFILNHPNFTPHKIRLLLRINNQFLQICPEREMSI